MLEKLGFDSPESLKRFLVLIVTPLLALLNAQFQVGVPDIAVAGVMGMAAAYIWQSGHKSAAVATAAATMAAAGVATPEDAAHVLRARAITPVDPKAAP